MTEPKDVAEFYDRFLETRMLSYRVHGNARIELASDLVCAHTSDGDAVADIGCGIGMTAEAVARRRPRARVIGVDLSSANIRFAQHSVAAPNVQFLVADVVADDTALRAFAPEGFDVIALVDVIEHIPAEQRAAFLTRLRQLAKSSATLVLAFPSPEYQSHLAEHQPDELQVIDNVIPADTLVTEARAAGWRLKMFDYLDLGVTDQYIHAVFAPADAPVRLEPARRNLFRRLPQRILARLAVPYRWWYYRRLLRALRKGGDAPAP